MALHVGVGKGGGDDVVVAHAGGNFDFRAAFAVDLHDQGDGVARQGLRIRLGDGGVEDVAGVAEFVPEGGGDVRRDGREDEQQDAQAFAAQAFFFWRDFAEGVQDFHRR